MRVPPGRVVQFFPASTGLRFVIAAFFALFAFAAQAATLTVGPGQTYSTINAAISAAHNGDTIVVYPNKVTPANPAGSYFETIDFQGLAITITSAPGGATIDGSQTTGPLVTFQHGETSTSVLSGFTLANGGNPSGNFGVALAGVYISASSPTITNNTVSGSYCVGILSNASSPTISNNEVDSTIDQPNTCLNTSGIGIYLDGSLNNFNGGTNITTPPVVVSGNLIQNNRLPAGASPSHEAAISVDGAYAILLGNTITNNTQASNGIVNVTDTDVIVIENNLIYNNTGGVSIQPPDATDGGFVGIIENNTIYGNAPTSAATPAASVPPGQLYLNGNYGQFVVVNNIIETTLSGTAGITCAAPASPSVVPLAIDHNDVFATNGGVSYAGSCSNQTGTFGNISADPLFASTSPPGNPFQLKAGSPALDSGNNSAPQLPATDILGNPRVADATGLPYAVVDMGAYEALPPAGSATAIPPTILTLTPSTYAPGIGVSALTLTARLTSSAGIPSGSVTFLIDGVAAGTGGLSSTGTATYAASGLTPGFHAFTSSYPGSSTFAPATSVKFFVYFPKPTPKLTLTTSGTPAVFGSQVTFTVKATSTDGIVPTPIALTDNGNPLTTLMPDATGTATYSTTTLAIGTHPIVASFAGTATDNPANSNTINQVIFIGYPTTTTLTASPPTGTVNSPVTLSSHVAAVTSGNGTPAGSVVFADGGTTLSTQTVDGSGNASYVATFSTQGTPSLTATFIPAVTANFATSMASLAYVVNGLTTNAVLTIAPAAPIFNQTSVLTATLSTAAGANGPTGVVTFFENSLPIGSTSISSGTASLSFVEASGGSHTFGCAYAGDTTYAPATCNTLTVTVAAASTNLTLASNANPAYALTPITFSSNLTIAGTTTPVPRAIVFALNGTPLNTGQVNPAGYNSINQTLNTGTYAVTASSSGDATYSAASAQLTEVVRPNPTSTTLLASPTSAINGQPVTLAVAVLDTTGAQSPNGIVTVTDANGNVVATGPTPPSSAANTLASVVLMTTTLTTGTHPLSASFTPADNNFLASSTSSTVLVTVGTPGFTLTANPPALSIQTQHHQSLTLTAASVYGFAGPVQLACAAPLPAYLSCEFASTVINVGGNGNASTTLTLETDAIPNFLSPVSPLGLPPSTAGRLITLAGLLTLGVLAFAGRKRRRLQLLAAAILALTLTTALSGCGDKYPDHTPPGVYTVTINAIGPPATYGPNPQASAQITLTVTP
jgi:parallel beta-helix repeat protein